MSTLFFGVNFFEELNWDGASLRVGRVNSESRSKIAEGLKRLSAETIRQRFMGAKRGFTEKELNELTLLDGTDNFALGVEDDQDQGIAVVRFSRQKGSPDTAEVGILIVDDFQKKGLGTFLLGLLVLAALERGVLNLSFTYLPENEGIVRLVKKIAMPEFSRRAPDEAQMRIDLTKIDLDQLKAQLSEHLPKIGTFRSEI